MYVLQKLTAQASPSHLACTMQMYTGAVRECLTQIEHGKQQATITLSTDGKFPQRENDRRPAFQHDKASTQRQLGPTHTAATTKLSPLRWSSRCGPCQRSKSPTSWSGCKDTTQRRRTETWAIACFLAALPRPSQLPRLAPGSR